MRGVVILSRCTAALVGNYALTIGMGSLLAAILAMAGMARVEAAALASMLAFPVFLLVMLWAIHEAKQVRLWVVIVGGSMLTSVAADWLVAWLGVVR